MVFHFRSSSVPMETVYEEAVNLYMNWELHDATLLGGWSAYRHLNSECTTLDIYSLDRAQPLARVSVGFGLPGTLFGDSFPEIPSSLAPIATWVTAEGERRIRPRTYLTCMVALAPKAALTPMSVDPTTAAVLGPALSQLRSDAVDHGLELVAPWYSPKTWVGGIGKASEILGCGGIKETMGTQRRRTFRGR